MKKRILKKLFKKWAGAAVRVNELWTKLDEIMSHPAQAVIDCKSGVKITLPKKRKRTKIYFVKAQKNPA